MPCHAIILCICLDGMMVYGKQNAKEQLRSSIVKHLLRKFPSVTVYIWNKDCSNAQCLGVYLCVLPHIVCAITKTTRNSGRVVGWWRLCLPKCNTFAISRSAPTIPPPRHSMSFKILSLSWFENMIFKFKQHPGRILLFSCELKIKRNKLYALNSDVWGLITKRYNTNSLANKNK